MRPRPARASFFHMHIAIVGRCQDTRYDVPYEADVSIWTCSPVMDEDKECCDLDRWDRWYDLHDLDYVETRIPGYLEWLKNACESKSVILSRQDDRIPGASLFPLKTVKALTPFAYFNNTISYLLAHAITEKADEISLYGVNMAAKTEYAHQRPSCEYWLGVAVGKGITVNLPEKSDLLKCGRLYGFEQTDMAAKCEARFQELKGRIEKEKSESEHMKNLGIVASGALKEIDHWKSKLNGQIPEEMIVEREKALKRQMDHCSRLAEDAHETSLRLEGALENLEWAQQWA